MKANHKALGIFALATVAAALLAADDKPGVTAAAKAGATAPDRVVVKAKGFEIKRSEMDKALEDVKKEAKAGGQEIPEGELATLEPKLLNHLILMQLLQARAKDEDKAKGRADADSRVSQLKEQMHGEEMLVTMLKTAGMTLDDLKKQLTTEAISHAVLRSVVTVGDDQVKKYYEANSAQFDEPEKVRASHILIGTKNLKTGEELSEVAKKEKKQQAEGLLKRARDGEDFAKLAKEFSDDPGSKDTGGEYKFGRGEMMPEFETAAFALKPGQVSDIVTTSFGYHIIKLSEKIPSRHVELAKVSPEIRETLQEQEIEKQLPKLYPQWRKDAQVEILDEKLKAQDAEEAERMLKAATQPTPKAEGK